MTWQVQISVPNNIISSPKDEGNFLAQLTSQVVYHRYIRYSSKQSFMLADRGLMSESRVPPLSQFQPDNLRIQVNRRVFTVCNIHIYHTVNS